MKMAIATKQPSKVPSRSAARKKSSKGLGEGVPLHRSAGLELPPGPVDEGERSCGVIGADAHGQIGHPEAVRGREPEDHRLQGILDSPQVRIAQHPDHRRVIAQSPQPHAHSLGRRQPETPCHHGIDEHVTKQPAASRTSSARSSDRSRPASSRMP